MLKHKRQVRRGCILIPQHLTTRTKQTNKYRLSWIDAEVWRLKQGQGTDNGRPVSDSVSHHFTAFYCLVTQCQQMCLHNLYCLSLTSCQHVCGNNWRLKLKTCVLGFGPNCVLKLMCRRKILKVKSLQVKNLILLWKWWFRSGNISIWRKWQMSYGAWTFTWLLLKN